MKTCIATFSSLNISIKAQKALSSNGIYGKIISIDPKITRRGCAYGIEFSCSDEPKIKQVLRSMGIKYGQIINNTGGKLL